MEERKSHCHHMTVVNTVGSSGNSSSRDSGRCGEGALKEELKSDEMFSFVELHYRIQQVRLSSINGYIVL